MIERLESRQLLAGDSSIVRPIPFVLEFGTDHASSSLHDKDGQGTGFTYVQPNKNGNEYQPSLIDLRTNEGVLRLTTAGNVANQGNYGKDNTQINALQTQFNPAGQAFTITTRLKGPLRPIAQPYEQAGIIFGPDQDNWVKLVMIATTDSVGIQFIDEQKVGTKLIRTLKATAYSPLPALHAVQTLDLIMSGTPSNGQVSAYYRVNGGPLIKVPGVLQLNEGKAASFFSSKSRAGIYTAQANDLPPEIMVFDRFVIEPGKIKITRPDITATRPAHRTTGVDRMTFVAADVFLPTPGSGIDESTINATTVKLYRTSDGAAVNVVRNTSGGGDALVVQPTAALAANTKYTFEVTAGLKDLSGASFIPYQAEFTTGTTIGNTDGSISFTKTSLSAATGEMFTSATIGPDNKLYATGLLGQIFRFNINSSTGALSSKQTINTITSNNGGPRAITGLAFDPSSTADNLIAYVTHSQADFETGDDWTGKLTRISGANLDSYSDWVTGLPRSIRDHLTNQLTFSPGGQLFFSQGSNSAMGAPDNAWGLRDERAMNAAIIVVDPTKLRRRIKDGLGPVNVKSAEGGTYDPFNTNLPVGLYATGIRNAYDLVFHSNGHLYVPANGSAAGGNTPGTPSNPFSTRRIDFAERGAYTGPSVPALTNVQETQNDYLFDVVRGGYYGHPNPTRSEYVMNGGNPTSKTDANQVSSYPVGTQPDRNYRGSAYTFGKNYSPNGVIEYRSNAVGGKLQGKLLVTRFSGGDDIAVLSLDSAGKVTGIATGIPGFTGFTDPLDLTEDRRNGNIYVVEHGGQKITLLKPNAVAATPDPEPTPPKQVGAGSGDIRVNTTRRLYNDVRGGAASETKKFVITNNGSGNLTITGASLSGTGASQFVITSKPSFPITLGPGGRTSIGVAFNPSSGTSPGIKIATLSINSNDPDRPVQTVRVRGLATTGTGGTNEPSLQRILDLYEIPVRAGDSNPDNVDLNVPLASPNDEVALPRMVKAGDGPVVIEPIAVFGVSSTPALKFGWYEPGTTQSRQELFQIGTEHAQSVSPIGNGSTSFDPRGAAFSFYSVWPGFKNSDGSTREIYSEDSLNTHETDASKRRKIRFYPLKNRDGSVVANAYVMAHEEFVGSTDQQDLVAIVRNVKLAPDSSRELGFENRDGVPFHNRMVFNRIATLDVETPNHVHDQAVLRLRNTGTSPLTLGRITVSGPYTLLGVPAEGTTIAGGSFRDITVKFNATSGNIHEGRLVVRSNDADEPLKGVELFGDFQSRSENQQEPPLADIVRMYGYSTNITFPGQVTNTGGLVGTIGDEVLSRYWTRADAGAPVTVRQLAAYHTMGDIPFVAWHNKGSNTFTELFRHTEADGQSLLPRKRGTLGPAVGSFNPTGTFGFNVDRAWSDDTKNPQEVNDGKHGHAVRFFPVKDREGRFVDNTWLMVMDYFGVNYDYNDNVHLVTNMKPEGRPAPPTGFTAIQTGSSQITLNWADYTGSNFAGYFVYRSTNPFTGFRRLNNTGLTASEFVDNATEPRGTTIYYRVLVNAPGSSMQASTLAKLV